jgi:RNA polymerase sigma-70 factor (ECF subfamily)
MSMNTVTFHEIYDRYARDVYRFAYWLSGDPAEADDIMADTFVRVWTTDSEIRFETVKAYLLTIARNIYLKRERRTRNSVPIGEHLPDTRQRPDESAEIRSELDATLKAMQHLPEIDRTVLLMVSQDELSYDEIARATGLTVAAAKVKVLRARIKLHTLVNTGESK